MLKNKPGGDAPPVLNLPMNDNSRDKMPYLSEYNCTGCQYINKDNSMLHMHIKQKIHNQSKADFQIT